MAPPRSRAQADEERNGNRPRISSLGKQDTPVIQVIGKISGEDEQINGSTGAKFLVHTAWSSNTFQVSGRGLKVLRNLAIRIIDEPGEYTI